MANLSPCPGCGRSCSPLYICDRCIPQPRVYAQAPIDRLATALQTALHQMEHMAAWITAQKAGYSFESLGEDMPGMREALLPFLPIKDRQHGT